MARYRTLLPVAVALLTVAASRRATAALPVPAGLQPGDSYHLVFNSSSFTNALSSNISFYNNFVQAAANAAGIGASEGVTWKAIASTASIDARVNAVVGANAPVYNTRSTGLQKIADGFNDMWDGTLDGFPAYNEFGNQNTVDPWTGSLPNGLRAAGSTLGHSSGTAWCGRPTLIDNRWITILEPSTFTQLTVYALSEALIVPDADFNSDNDVDGGDFLAWQRGAGDADGDGASDGDDLAFWQQQFGRGANAIATVAVVPEPSGMMLVLVAAAITTSGRTVRRRWGRRSRL